MSTSKIPLEVKTSSPLDSPIQGDFTIDPAIERRIIRKLDFQVVPVLCFLFFVSFVDRGNIGMSEDMWR